MTSIHAFANQVVERCSSTNDLAKQLAEAGFPHGTWVSSRFQDSGRGRQGRKWESREGNLFLSVVARIENRAAWSWIPLTVAIAVAQFLRNKYLGLNIRIKWPNDLWHNGAKLGGILCEGSHSRQGPFVIVGIGLNCIESPSGLNQKTTDLSSICGPRMITADDIREGILESLAKHLNSLGQLQSQDYLNELRSLYESWAVFPPGTAIEWSSPPQVGEIISLGPSAELLVRDRNGDQVSLFAEDIHPVKILKGAGEFLA